jgi:hypothetical protein
MARMTWDFERKLRAAILAPLGPIATYPDTRVIERDGWFQRISPSSAGINHNEVLRSAVDEADAEQVIDSVVAEYRSLGKPTTWHTGPWTRPLDFGERLLRRGFRCSKSRGMGCDTSADIASGHVRVRRLETVDELDSYLSASRLAWGVHDDDLEATRARYRLTFGTLQFFFVAEGVGAAAVVLREDYGYFVGGAVVEQARGHGVYRTLVAARLAFLRERGIEYAVTNASEATSAPMLEHLGFETLFSGARYQLDP